MAEQVEPEEGRGRTGQAVATRGRRRRALRRDSDARRATHRCTIPDLAPDQVCLAMAATRTSPVVDDFFAAAQSTAEITAECGNYEMWQLGNGAVSKHG
jgi:hypothetical protein